MRMKWYGPMVRQALYTEVGDRIDAACRVLRDYCREKLSVPGRVLLGMTKKGKKKYGGYNTEPSLPGEYPRKQLGHLRRNVASEADKHAAVGRVGTNVPYGRFLELGTRKMKRRPWLSRGLQETMHQLQQVLGRTWN